MCTSVIVNIGINVVYLNTTQHTIYDMAVSPRSIYFLYPWRNARDAAGQSLALAVTNWISSEISTETKERDSKSKVVRTPPGLDEEDGCMDTTQCLYTHYNRLSYLILILVIYASDRC